VGWISVNLLELSGFGKLDKFVCPVASRDERGWPLM
jgi:hypothetical protein